MDEFTVFVNTFKDALDNLENVLQRCQDTNLSLSHEKCHMLMTKGIVLGNHISANEILVNPKKIEIIKNIPTPHKPKYVHSFLGHIRYYRRVIKDFIKIASLLFELLSKDNEFKWSLSCQESFDTLKGILTITLVLCGHNCKSSFHIYIDAFDIALGAMLG